MDGDGHVHRGDVDRVVRHRLEHVGAGLREARRRHGPAGTVELDDLRVERHPAGTSPVQPGDREAGGRRLARVDHGLRLRPAAHVAARQRLVRRREAVVPGQHRQLQPVRQGDRACGIAVDADRRGLVVVVALGGAGPPVQPHDVVIDLPHRPERREGLVRPAVVRDGPDEVPVAPVGRHAHLVDELLPARVEVRRLPPVGVARLEEVVLADGNDRLLLVVPVQVAEHHGERPVGVPLPAFEHRLDVLAGQPPGLPLRRCAGKEHRHDCTDHRARWFHHRKSPCGPEVCGSARHPAHASEVRPAPRRRLRGARGAGRRRPRLRRPARGEAVSCRCPQPPAAPRARPGSPRRRARTSSPTRSSCRRWTADRNQPSCAGRRSSGCPRSCRAS